jgi:hypothetical protein
MSVISEDAEVRKLDRFEEKKRRVRRSIIKMKKSCEQRGDCIDCDAPHHHLSLVSSDNRAELRRLKSASVITSKHSTPQSGRTKREINRVHAVA